MQERAGRLAGKAALITGAASGIGRATAALFHAEGAKVAATDRNEAGLDEVEAVRRSRAAAGRDRRSALARRWSTRSSPPSDSSTSSSTAPGSARRATSKQTTLADWRKINAVNVEGTFLGCREAVRVMKETGGGSIVNLSSVAGIIGDAQTIAYCASKGAVRLLTKSAALHCGRSGYKIRVNSVHPSFAETAMVQELIASSKNPERVREGLARAAPLGRLGRAEEVAAAILYLASDESSFTTGAEIVVDGGLTAQ